MNLFYSALKLVLFNSSLCSKILRLRVLISIGITAAEMKYLRKNSRTHLDRLLHEYRDCNGIKHNHSLG